MDPEVLGACKMDPCWAHRLLGCMGQAGPDRDGARPEQRIGAWLSVPPAMQGAHASGRPGVAQLGGTPDRGARAEQGKAGARWDTRHRWHTGTAGAPGFPPDSKR